MIDKEILIAAELVLSTARARGWQIGTAESCTGGMIAGALTAIAGSSDVVQGGLVTYSNEAKTLLLGISAADIARHGAVSQETARAMASGVLSKLPAVDLAIAITGIAGPGGGSTEKPVGLVYFGLASKGRKTTSVRHVFSGDRTAIRRSTVLAALKILVDAANEI